MRLKSIFLVPICLLCMSVHAIDVDKAFEAAAKPKSVSNEAVIDGSALAAQRDAEGKVSGILDERARKRREFWEPVGKDTFSGSSTAIQPQNSHGTRGTGTISIKEWGRMDTVLDKPTGYEVRCSSGKTEIVWRRPGGDWFHKHFPNGRFVAKGSVSLEDAARQFCQ